MRRKEAEQVKREWNVSRETMEGGKLDIIVGYEEFLVEWEQRIELVETTGHGGWIVSRETMGSASPAMARNCGSLG